MSGDLFELEEMLTRSSFFGRSRIKFPAINGTYGRIPLLVRMNLKDLCKSHRADRRHIDL